MGVRVFSKILIVAELAEDFCTLQSLLDPLPCECVRADLEALPIEHEIGSSYALVLFDFRRFDVGCKRTLEVLEGLSGILRTPILLMTEAPLSRNEQIKAYRAGIADVLTKSIEPEILRAKVRVFLDLHASRSRDSRVVREALELGEAKLATMLESSPVGVLLVNERGEIEDMNPVGRELWGGFVPTKKSSDYDAYRGFWPETGEPLAAADWACARAFETGQNIPPRRVRILTFDDRERFITAAARPVLNRAGKVVGAVGINQDITDLVRVEQRIKDDEAKFKTITEAMPQMVWSTLPDGFHDYYNRRWYEFTGVPEGSTDGEAWNGMFHPEDQQRTWGVWRHSLATGDPYEIEYRLRHRSGEYRWVLGRALPVRDDHGQIIRWMGTCTDIHEQKTSAEKLAAAKSEAERANQLKSAFLANMSHEIRTPLAAMLGFADLLRDPGVTLNERATFIDILTRNGKQLAVIINDILDLSKVEAGHLTLEVADVHPAQVAEEVLSLLRVKAKEKDLVLEYESDGTIPRKISADPTRVKQVLLNLVSNAVKFTKYGKISIRSYGCETEDGRTAACFEVSDTGMGIPPDKIDSVFEAFVQADNSMTRRFGGTGLGLALSRQLARAMGGDITVTRTELNVGTTFLFEVADQDLAPTYIEEDIRGSRRSNGEHAPDLLKGVRVLVVDDSPDNQALLWQFLTKHGAIVDAVGNGYLGYRKALASNLDIVLMDLQMPEMDGYTATQRLRAAGFQKPIVALTAHAMSEVREKCLSVGCTSHLPKPIDPYELVSTVARLTRDL